LSTSGSPAQISLLAGAADIAHSDERPGRIGPDERVLVSTLKTRRRVDLTGVGDSLETAAVADIQSRHRRRATGIDRPAGRLPTEHALGGGCRRKCRERREKYENYK
jgi:hypothetical protein